MREHSGQEEARTGRHYKAGRHSAERKICCVYGRRAGGSPGSSRSAKRLYMAAAEVSRHPLAELAGGGEGLRASERMEVLSRARVIARKVWFLRHAAQCRDPQHCWLRPCPKAVELVTHMRACGAINGPSQGCRAPVCAHAARLLHHPLICTRGMQCTVCLLLRRAGSSGKGLLLPKDFRDEASDDKTQGLPPSGGTDDDDATKRKVRFNLAATNVVVTSSLPNEHFSESSPISEKRHRTLSERSVDQCTLVNESDGMNLPFSRDLDRESYGCSS